MQDQRRMWTGFYGIGSVSSLFCVFRCGERTLPKRRLVAFVCGWVWRDFVCQREDGCCNICICRAQLFHNWTKKKDIGRMWPGKRQSSNYSYFFAQLFSLSNSSKLFLSDWECLRRAKCKVISRIQCFSLKCRSRGPRWDMRIRVDLPIAIMLKTESKRSL